MNYKKIHDEIIYRSINRKPPDCYCEKHHIIPKSLGGTNAKDNLVILTAREHYLIHWLLYKIHRSRSMAFAWYSMTRTKQATYRYTSHSYSYAKKARAIAVSEMLTGRKLTSAHKEKLRHAKLGKPSNRAKKEKIKSNYDSDRRALRKHLNQLRIKDNDHSKERYLKDYLWMQQELMNLGYIFDRDGNHTTRCKELIKLQGE